MTKYHIKFHSSFIIIIHHPPRLWERRLAGHGLWERTPAAVGGRNSIKFDYFSIIFRFFSWNSNSAPPPTLWEGAREPIFRFVVALVLTSSR